MNQVVMTLKERNRILIDKIHDLYALIGKPDSSSWAQNAVLSDKINALIRGEYLYLRDEDYVCGFYDSRATIKPNADAGKVRTSVTPEKAHLYEKIYANSFGPFVPEEYFKLPKEQRIVWLLKEPYISRGTWYGDTHDRGGHPQAAEYNNWKKVKKAEPYGGTKTNLIKYTKVLLEKLDYPVEGEDEDEKMNQVMNHICILEVNHFPGLAFRGTESDNSLLKGWAEINTDFLQLLIDFYNPNIVIGGSTFEYWDFENFSQIYDKIKGQNLTLFNRVLVEWSYIEAGTSNIVSTADWDDSIIMTKSEENDALVHNVGRNIIYVGVDERTDNMSPKSEYLGQRRFYIQAYHPSQGFRIEDAIPDAKRIKRWRNPS